MGVKHGIVINDHIPRKTMVPRGLEPRTLQLLAVRSNQLSYETSRRFQVHALMRSKRSVRAPVWQNQHTAYDGTGVQEMPCMSPRGQVCVSELCDVV